MTSTQKAFDFLNEKIDAYCDYLKTNKKFQKLKNERK